MADRCPTRRTVIAPKRAFRFPESGRSTVWDVSDQNIMFTPEFSTTDATEHTLIANHYVETEDALNLSVAFVRVRILFGRQHVPLPTRFVAHYDVRGQRVVDDLEGRLDKALGDVAEVRVKRS
ncbi:hypothetical protein PQR21_34510 [Paraburkholderia nemoris]|uniref:hypothetical protein n=1 Tax=Paraburkholderia nemoris TaxID=2793076 RepID=UPI0038BA7A9C